MTVETCKSQLRLSKVSCTTSQPGCRRSRCRLEGQPKLQRGQGTRKGKLFLVVLALLVAAGFVCRGVKPYACVDTRVWKPEGVVLEEPAPVFIR